MTSCENPKDAARPCSIRPERWLILQQHRPKSSRSKSFVHHIANTKLSAETTDLLLLVGLGELLSPGLLLALSLLQQRLRDEHLLLGDSPAKTKLVRSPSHRGKTVV